MAITIFYDGKCGLCSKEIEHYRKIAPRGIFHWQDITQSMVLLSDHGGSLSEGLKKLHAVDESGKLLRGVDAFILIWQQLDYWKMLAFIVRLPGIYKVAGWLYDAFAQWRFSRLDHCQLAEQQTG